MNRLLIFFSTLILHAVLFGKDFEVKLTVLQICFIYVLKIQLMKVMVDLSVPGVDPIIFGSRERSKYSLCNGFRLCISMRCLIIWSCLVK